MKLCRFELHADPGIARSGIYHDGRYYETDGERAVGIHDPGSVRLLPPIGTPPSLRFFDEARDASGNPFLTYSYGNSARLQGPNSDVDASGTDESLDFDVRIAALVQESARNVDPFEASRLILGFGIVLSFFEPDESERLVSLGLSDAPARDLGTLFGPFLCTPDELLEHRASPDPLEFNWSVQVEVNGEIVSEVTASNPSFSGMLALASTKGPVLEGDLLAGPAFKKTSLVSGVLGRYLMATDRVSVTVEPLGTLVGRII